MKNLVFISLTCLCAGGISAHAFPGPDRPMRVSIQKSVGGPVRNSDMAGRNLNMFTLNNLKVVDSNFEHSSLQSTIGEGVSFVNTNLFNTDFSYSTLRETEFIDLDFNTAIFRNVEAPKLRMIDVGIENSNFEGLKSEAAQFIDVRAANSDFTSLQAVSSVFTDVAFAASTLAKADFETANLTDVSFSGTSPETPANLKNISFVRTHMTSVQFSNVDLTDTSFREAYLRNVTFDHAQGLTVDAFANACGKNVLGLPQGVSLHPC